jgi:hypothetical protein
MNRLWKSLACDKRLITIFSGVYRIGENSLGYLVYHMQIWWVYLDKIYTHITLVGTHLSFFFKKKEKKKISLHGLNKRLGNFMWTTWKCKYQCWAVLTFERKSPIQVLLTSRGLKNRWAQALQKCKMQNGKQNLKAWN